MAARTEVEGYDAFCKLIAELEKQSTPIYVYFSGSKDSSGKSWCPDCVEAEPVVAKVAEEAGKKIHFVYSAVGDRAQWKDPKCPFRTDKRLRLKCVPTLLVWGQPEEKLEDSDCVKEDLVSMLFEQS